jgi:hypothetical protein
MGLPLRLQNAEASQVDAGTVCYLYSSGDKQIKKTTAQYYTGQILVAQDNAAASAWGRFVQNGMVTILVQGNVTRGNFLRVSATAGRAEDAGSTLGKGCMGLALTGYAGGGAGSITALLFGRTYLPPKYRIRIPADAMNSKIAAGYALYEWQEGTNFFWGQMKFDAQNEICYLPPWRLTNWDGGNITVRIGYKSNATSGSTQLRLSLVGRSTTTPETWDAAMTNHDLTSSSVPGTAEQLKEISESISVSELANNDAVLGKITRLDVPGPAEIEILYIEFEYQGA